MDIAYCMFEKPETTPLKEEKIKDGLVNTKLEHKSEKCLMACP